MVRLVHCRCLALLAFLLLAWPLAAQENRNIRFGKPAAAKSAYTDPSVEDVPIERAQYVLSYNGKKYIPNWVSWNLTASDVGTTPRSSAFEPDPDLPKGLAKVSSAVYNSGGFDRGHMCPSKDRSDSEANNEKTFLLSNVVPQSPKNNEITWEHLEAYCRDLAKGGSDLHIVAGPQGMRGEGKGGFANSISKGNITVVVPAFTWKVIMVLPDAKAQPDKRTRLIAVVVPNTQSVEADWSKYRCPVHHVEELTGFTFFPKLDEALGALLKEQIDEVPIAVTPMKKGKKTKLTD